MRKNGLFPHQSKYFKVTVNLKGPICRKGQEQNDYVDRYHWNIYATIRERSVDVIIHVGLRLIGSSQPKSNTVVLLTRGPNRSSRTKIQTAPSMTSSRLHQGCLQTTQEVRLLDRLSSCLTGTLCYLRALVKTFGCIVHTLDGRITVVRGGCDIVGVVVGGNLGRELLSASGELLLVALSLLLVQGCDKVNFRSGMD